MIKTNVFNLVPVVMRKQYLLEEFEDTKGVFRIRKSKNRQYNGQKKKDKRTLRSNLAKCFPFPSSTIRSKYHNMMYLYSRTKKIHLLKIQ